MRIYPNVVLQFNTQAFGGENQSTPFFQHSFSTRRRMRILVLLCAHVRFSYLVRWGTEKINVCSERMDCEHKLGEIRDWTIASYDHHLLFVFTFLKDFPVLFCNIYFSCCYRFLAGEGVAASSLLTVLSRPSSCSGGPPILMSPIWPQLYHLWNMLSISMLRNILSNVITSFIYSFVYQGDLDQFLWAMYVSYGATTFSSMPRKIECTNKARSSSGDMPTTFTLGSHFQCIWVERVPPAFIRRLRSVPYRSRLQRFVRCWTTRTYSILV